MYIELDVNKDYPFRPSLTNLEKARCGFCKFNGENELGYSCQLGHQIKYPTQVTEHFCQDYQYKEDKISEIPKGKLAIFMGIIDKLPECNECGYNLKNRCSGLRWYPFKKEPQCEFFIDKGLICENAVPYLQYGNHFRNNYCKLEPKLRSDSYNQQSWECNCPQAHEKPKYFDCYKPIKEGK
jgi:hypothetical protein